MSYVRKCECSSTFNGSIPFCDNSSPEGGIAKQLHFTEDELYNETDDTSDISALIQEPRISNGKSIVAAENRRDQSLYYSTSCPIQVPQCSGRVTRKPAYGSVPNDPESSQAPVQHVIYCVHGYPKGHCVASNPDIIDNNYNTPNPNKRKESYTATIIGDHCHQARTANIDKKARRKLIIASILCVLFMAGEIVGGVLSSSLAIATDAAHLLTDFASFMISLFSLWVASRPPTRTMSFGWYRAEVIGALTSVLMIWVVTGILVYLAVERVVTRDFEIESTTMLITSAIGVIVNIVMGLTLHQHGHSHSDHQHINEAGHSVSQNINVRAAYIHVLGDFIQSFGVFVAALIIYFKPSWGLVDPICTFLFSILVLITTFAILKDTMLVLMEGLPKGVDFVKVMNTFLQIDGVIRVHNLRIWALSMDKCALSAHLAICPGRSPQKVLDEASHQIRSQFEFFEMTLQIEEFNENMEQCSQCKCPES